ncbi:hypothetical protein GCM10027570_08870 [Streptomonospora sediminis]
MRPQIRDGIRCVPGDDGVYLHGDHGVCTLKGAQAAEWLSRLTPHLTGERTLDELTSGLPGDYRSHVVHLVEALAAEGFVLDAADEEPHGLTGPELDTYAAEIAFIRYRLASAERRFERFRQARIALTGHGPVLSALLESGLASGWRRIVVEAPDREADRLSAAAARGRRGGDQCVHLADVPHATEPADVLLQVDDRRARLAATAEALTGTGTQLGQILLEGDEAWIHPVAPAETAGACWHRMGGLPPPGGPSGGRGAAGPSGGAPPDDLLTGAVPGLLGARLALSCFSRLTGLAGADEPPTRIDLRTLDSHRHRVPPVGAPAPRSAGSVRAAIGELAGADPISPQQLLDRAAACVDPRTGLFGSLDEDDLVQTPLSVCAALVGHPAGSRPGGRPAPRVVGWGADRATARTRTVLAACAAYGALGAGGGCGIELLSGRSRPLAASAALPDQADRADPAGPAGLPPSGYGAGLTWNAALAAALRSRAEELIIRTLRAQPAAAPPAQLLQAAADTATADLLSLLKTAGETPAATDLSGVLKLPAYRVQAAGATIITCADTETTALRNGLERAVLAWQSRAAGRPGGATEPQPWWPGDDPPQWRPIAEALQAAGSTPVAAPLPVGDTPTPHAVRVELFDG